MDFFCPILEHFCPLFEQIAQMGSLFAQMKSLFAQISTPNPCSLHRRHTPLSGICTYIKRPPTPPQNIPQPRWPRPAPPSPVPRPPAPAPARRRRAQRWKMRSKWSSSTCRAPRESCSANAAVRERQRKCDGVNAAARGWRRDAATEKCGGLRGGSIRAAAPMLRRENDGINAAA